MTIPVHYSFRSLWVRRRTTLASAIGIGLVVFVLAASQMLADGVRETLLAAGRDDRALVMSHDTWAEDGSRLSQSVASLVAAAPGVQRGDDQHPLVSGESVVQIPFAKRGAPERISSVQVRGVTEAAFALRPEVRLIEGRKPRPGTSEAILGKGIVERYEDLALGAPFELKKGVPISVVGIFEADGAAYESEVWVELDALRTSMHWETHLSSVTAKLESPSAFDAFALALEADKRQGLDVHREREYYERVSRNLSRSILGLGILVTFIFSMGAMLGAMITMHGAVMQRGREIGTMLALGFRPRQLLLLFVVEAGMLALAGAGVGVLLAALTPLIDFSTTNMATGQELTFRFLPSLGVLFGSAALGTVVGALGGFFPALRAARMAPVLTMRR